MGFKEHMIEVSETPLQLKGFEGNLRKGKAAHIRIKGSGWRGQNYVRGMSNDLGFERMEDGTFRFHVSEYDVTKYGELWQQQLQQNYAVEIIKKIARQEGHEFIPPTKQGENLVCKIRSCY
jgi:hypothetical protein